MTLNTSVYALNEVDPDEVFNFCRLLLGTPEHIPILREESIFSEGDRAIRHPLGVGLPALLWLHYKPGAPYVSQEVADACTSDCKADCDKKYHSVACWLEISFDTGYSYRDEIGGCGDLHARYVFALGRWFDERGIGWGWNNEFTGENFFGDDKYEKLSQLGRGGADAQRWFESIALPAIRSDLAARIAQNN